MNRADPGTIAILWRGDRTTRRQATPHNNRFHRIFEELARLGLRAEPAVYDETFADEVRAQLLQAEGVLVWVNPLQDGKTRHCLDAMLREVASNGPWVSAHPDTILKMGTKEVLVRTRHLGWGTDTQLYASMAQFRDAFAARLAAGAARVLKQSRGNDGQGVWKVKPVASGLSVTRDMSGFCSTRSVRFLPEGSHAAGGQNGPDHRCDWVASSEEVELRRGGGAVGDERAALSPAARCL